MKFEIWQKNEQYKGYVRGVERGIEQGLEQGLAQGQRYTVFELFRDQVLPVQMAAQKLALDESEFLKAFDSWEKEQKVASVNTV